MDYYGSLDFIALAKMKELKEILKSVQASDYLTLEVMKKAFAEIELEIKDEMWKGL